MTVERKEGYPNEPLPGPPPKTDTKSMGSLRAIANPMQPRARAMVVRKPSDYSSPAEAAPSLLNSYLVDPIADPRWAQLIDRDARATVFHSPGWLQALRHTYGYQPVVLTTNSPARPLANGIVFCEIRSWFTGSRLVSLPFSDHCEPLVEGEDPGEIANRPDSDQWRYIELRPLDAAPKVAPGPRGFQEAQKFCLHRLDLSPTADQIFRRFHSDCIRRKIRKAEKEHVVCEEGNNAALLDTFYELLLRTRRRHRLPPQPKSWFRNLSRFLPDNIKIRVASKDGLPIASILTFHYKNTFTYKYGCSDERYHRFGGTQFLLWMAIQEAKQKNCSEFDLGRTEWENSGLRKFKDRWGATSTPLTYWRFCPGRFSADHEQKLARRILRYCPPILLEAAGRSFYRHIG